MSRYPQTDQKVTASTNATLIAASLGFAVVQLDVFVVNVAVRPIGNSLGGGTAALQWVVGAYTLAFATLILTAGGLGDRFGARRIYIIGIGIFVVSSVVCALAVNVAMLVAARSVQGGGAAMLGASSLALLNHTFTEPAERARAFAIWAAGASTALAAGPLVGGLLISGFGWRSVFLINLPVGAVGWWLARAYTSETPTTNRPPDVVGQVLAITALGTLAAALIRGGTAGYTSPIVLGAFAVSAATAGAFVWAERRSAAPMLPVDLLSRSTFVAPIAVGILVNVAFYGLIFVFSLYFQTVRGDSPLGAGVAFLPLTAAVLAGNLASPRIAARVGVRRAIAGGITAIAFGCAGLLGLGQSTAALATVAQLIALGAGLGVVVPPMTQAVMSSTNPDRSGVAAGTLNAARQTGSLLGVAIFGSFLEGGQFMDGVTLALVASIGVALAALVVTATGPTFASTARRP